VPASGVRPFDWNAEDGAGSNAASPLALLDETLRDGLQSPSVRHPGIAEKVHLLHLMNEIGIATASVGYPGAGERARRDAEALCREIIEARLQISAKCVGRTCAEDVIPVVEVAQRVGATLEIGLFVSSSPIRRYAEGWDWDRLLRMTEKWVAFAHERGLRVLFVTEDTTRSRPEDVTRLYQAAVRAGAQYVCLADTVGCATPVGVEALVRFVRASLDAAGGSEVGLDWHGHNDRGLAVANALAAARAGADRLHGTALGLGERVGNAALEHILINAAMLGWAQPRLDRLTDYLQAVGVALRVEAFEHVVAEVAHALGSVAPGPKRGAMRNAAAV
jgi:2-isopropylmalate synthase